MRKRKLSYPTYRQPPLVTFGSGSVRTLGDPDVLDGAVLLVSAQSSVQSALRAALDRAEIPWDTLSVLEKPEGEPTAESVTRGAEWLSSRRCSTLIAVGGGSVLDWARLSLGAARGWVDVTTGVSDQRARFDDRPEIVLVPTTCGTGAEAAGVAVYSTPAGKRAVVSSAFIADRVILDGQFLASLDAPALASFLSDALSHAVEGFLSIVPNQLAKEAALSTLRVILEHYPTSPGPCRNERLMEAGYLGGVAASNCSVGVVHAFAHTISTYGVSHGVANALGLIAGIEANADTAEMRRLVQRTGFDSVAALIQAIEPITGAALSTGAAGGVRAALADSTVRTSVVAGIMSDVCFRTNPRRLDQGEVAGFLERVERMLPVV